MTAPSFFATMGAAANEIKIESILLEGYRPEGAHLHLLEKKESAGESKHKGYGLFCYARAFFPGGVLLF